MRTTAVNLALLLALAFQAGAEPVTHESTPAEPDTAESGSRAQADTYVAQVCELPAVRICSEDNVALSEHVREEVLKRVAEYREKAFEAGDKAKQAYLRAQSAAAEKPAALAPDVKRGITLIAEPEDEAFEEAFLTTFEAQLKSELPDISGMAARAVHRLKDRVNQAPLEQDKRKQILRKLETVRIVSSLSELEEKKADPEGDVAKSFRYQCKGGSGFQAFYKERENLVVVCPGDLMFHMERSRKPDGTVDTAALEQQLVFTLGHEIGHGFDATTSVGKEPYRKLLACLKKHAEGVEDFDRKAGEITADWWSAEAMASFIAELPASQRIQALQHTFAALCGKNTGGYYHPPVEARLQMMLSSPTLRNALGCPASTVDHPGCDLDGAHPSKSNAPSSPFSP